MTLPTAAKRVAARAVLMVIVMTAATGVVSAQAMGPEIPIWVGAVESHDPVVAFDIIHEEFLVVWSNTQGPNTQDIYARRVNMDGSLGTWFSVVSAAGEHHNDPAVAYSEVRDEYLVAWSYEYAVGDYDIFGSLVSWNGSSIGTPFVINGNPEIQHDPDVAFNPNDDEYLVVYGNSWTSGLQDIAAQRVDGDGSLLSWANIATSPGGSRYSARVAFSPEQNTYLIGYTRWSGGVAGYDVAGKIAAPDLAGVSAAPEIAIVDDIIFGVYNPAVGATADGFITLYNLPTNVRARRLAADGTPMGLGSGFPLGHQSSLGISYPSRANAVARADAVGFVSAWYQLGLVDADVYAQVVSPSSDNVLSPTFTVDDGVGHQLQVDIDCAPWGTCLIVYQSDTDIVGKIIRLNLFGDDFESGDTRHWSRVLP